MMKDVLEYLDYLKVNDKFLYSNYKKIYLLISDIINNDEVYDFYNSLEEESKCSFNYNTYSDNDILNYVSNFFKSINTDLLNIFSNNIKSGNIIYDKSISKPDLITVRDCKTLELEKYSIEIPKTNTIKDMFSMVHEFTHYLINDINKNKSINKGIINILDEVIAIYSELLFFDYIKKEVTYSEAKKCIEDRVLTCFSQGIDLYASYYAIHLICNGKTYDEVVKSLNDDIFFNEFKNKVKSKQPYNYEHFMGTIIALKLYNDKVNLLDLIKDTKLDELIKIVTFDTDVVCSLFIKVKEMVFQNNKKTA